MKNIKINLRNVFVGAFCAALFVIYFLQYAFAAGTQDITDTTKFTVANSNWVKFSFSTTADPSSDQNWAAFTDVNEITLYAKTIKTSNCGVEETNAHTTTLNVKLDTQTYPDLKDVWIAWEINGVAGQGCVDKGIEIASVGSNQSDATTPVTKTVKITRIWVMESSITVVSPFYQGCEASVTVGTKAYVSSYGMAPSEKITGVTAFSFSAPETVPDGFTFVGWSAKTSAGDFELFKASGSCTLQAGKEWEIAPTFMPTADASEGYYQVGDDTSTLYYFLDEAIGKAVKTSASKVTVAVSCSVALANGTECVIPKGITLLIPYNDDNTLITDNMGSHISETTSTDASSSTLYRQLTMANGVNIAVNGAISIGSQASRQMAGQVGPYGSIVMMNGSNITVESGAYLYAYGYIFYGDDTGGTVTVKSGGTVYECAFAMDYPGSASNVQTLYNNQVFPMRVFTIRNVEVPMTFHSGAEEKAFYCIYGTTIGTYPGYFQLVGNTSSAPFCLKTNATLTKSYKNSRQKLVISGTTELNSISMTLKTGFLGDYPVTSANTSGFPVPSGFEIELSSGSLTLNDNVILLEGSKLTVAKGANLYTAGYNLYVLDADDDDGPRANAGKDVHGVQYTTLAIDAVLDINGTVTINGGGLYTSAGNACVQSSNGTGKIVFDGANVTDVTLNYRYGSSAQYEALTMTSASLQHADGKTYLETSDCEGSETYNYCNVHGGKWVKGDVKLTVNRVEPACEATGAEEKTCTCGYSNTVTIAALGHTRVVDAEVAPTCTETGLTEGCHCSVCNEVLTAQEVIAALGHAWNWGGWSSATNGQQCTCTCGNDDSHTITVLLAYRMDSYIWLNATVSSNVGTPVCNEMTLQADKYLVQKVLSNHITDSVAVSFTLNGTTPELEIGFPQYSTLLKASIPAEETERTDAQKKLYNLLIAMENYGTAADKYFDNVGTTPDTVSKPGSSATIQKPEKDSEYDKKGVGSLILNTTGATVFFDEALRLGVGYGFTGATVNADGTITIGNEKYTVLQVGVLTKQLTSWTMGDVLYADTESGATAYIVYNGTNSGATVTPGGSLNKPDVGSNPISPSFTNSLAASGVITFDLSAAQYKSPFALRTYAVVLDSNNVQHVIYGGQYVYGLEAYIQNVFGTVDSDATTDDQAFDWLLSTVAAYAEAAYAKYGG